MNKIVGDFRQGMQQLWSSIGAPCIAPMFAAYLDGKANELFDDVENSQNIRAEGSTKKKVGAEATVAIAGFCPSQMTPNQNAVVRVFHSQWSESAPKMALFLNGIFVADISAPTSPDGKSCLVCFTVPKLSAREQKVALSLQYLESGIELDRLDVPYSSNGSFTKGEASISPQVQAQSSTANTVKIASSNVEDILKKSEGFYEEGYEDRLVLLYDEYWGIQED